MSSETPEPGWSGTGAVPLDLVLDQVVEAVAVVEPDGSIAYANELWRRFAEGPDEPPADTVARLRTLPDFLVRRRQLPDGRTLILVRQDEGHMFRELFDNLDSTVAVYDRSERYRYANAAYHRLYPHQQDEGALVGKTFEQLLWASIAAGHHAEPQAATDPEGYVRRRLSEFREMRPGESERLSPSGRWDLLRIRFTPSGLRLSMRTEITEQKRIQEALRHAKERLEIEAAIRARFVTKLGHDLRTPLSAVLGYAELIEGEVLGPLGSPRYQQYAALIRQSGRQLLDLVEGLLETSRSDAQRMEMRESTIDLPALLRGELPAVQHLSRENRTQVSLVLPSGIPNLRGDPRMVRQMALALVSNAVRHTIDGVVTIRIRHREDQGIDIEVADTGTGMAPEVLARVGEPYFRGAPPAGDGEPGTGLGIALVKDLLSLHQGSFAIASTLGEGTVATLSFPPERSSMPDDAEVPR